MTNNNPLAQQLFDSASAMNKAAAKLYACSHCRGAGVVSNWTDGGTKPCWACDGTGGPRRYKLGYKLHGG